MEMEKTKITELELKKSLYKSQFPPNPNPILF